MIARVCYALLAVSLLTLAAVFAVRVSRARHHGLPNVEPSADVAGQSCEQAAKTAQTLTKGAAFDRARLAYLWILSHCDNSPVLPDAMLQAGSLFGHLMNEPHEAQRVYETFLHRFPDHPETGDVIFHLARLEIDAGDYSAAVAHLTTLAKRYPNNWHEESAKFLASRAAEMLAAERHSRRTVLGQLAQFIPNNLASLLVLLTAVGPSVIQTVHKARGESASERSKWMVPTIVIGLTILNYTINNVDSARRNKLLMEKLDRLAAAVQPQQGQ
jgi:outer membrane protein assembly factor BamD (BamD/ComL family)